MDAMTGLEEAIFAAAFAREFVPGTDPTEYPDNERLEDATVKQAARARKRASLVLKYFRLSATKSLESDLVQQKTAIYEAVATAAGRAATIIGRHDTPDMWWVGNRWGRLRAQLRGWADPDNAEMARDQMSRMADLVCAHVYAHQDRMAGAAKEDMLRMHEIDKLCDGLMDLVQPILRQE